MTRRQKFKRMVTRDPKTTVTGVITALAAFIAMNPADFAELPPLVITLAKFIMVGGLAGLGIMGRDSSPQVEPAKE